MGNYSGITSDGTVVDDDADISTADTSTADTGSVSSNPKVDSEGFTDNGDGTYNYTIGNTTYTIDKKGTILEQHDSFGKSNAGIDTTLTPTKDTGGLADLWNFIKANPKVVGALGVGALPILAKAFPGLKSLTEADRKTSVYDGTNANKAGIDMISQHAIRGSVPYQYNPNRRPGGATPAQMIASADGTEKYTQMGGITGPRYYSTPEQQAAAEAAQNDEVRRMYIANQLPTVQAATGGEINTPYSDGGIMVGYAQGGQAGRYLRGGTDGMADKLHASIDGKQPAKLSHGEFVIPADVVSHLGNGNSDAGAQKLYSMMDKVRHARTGTKKQGKQINPDKFLPGYAGGGVVAFNTGGTTSIPAGATGTSSGLNQTFGPYVTNMMGQANALADSPYQAYQGSLTAGASGLQQQGFGMAANLAPSQYTNQAAQAAGGIGATALESSYNPTSYGNTYQGTSPYQAGTFSNTFQAPTGSGTQATNFTNQFTAPGAYQGSNITTGTFGTPEAQKYMNPYLQAALNPQLDEMRRQAQITQMGNDAKMVGAGAFGGSRQALMNTETQRNLMNSMESALGTGYKNAYDAATQQFNADQNRALQAATTNEQSRQFGAGQGMTAAQLQAQYGLSAQQAQEAARQFNQGQAMTGAQNTAQYGLAAQQAAEASRQFAANQAQQNAQSNAQYGLAANQLTNQDKQFGANFGLQGLNTALNAATLQGNMGAQQNNQGIANLNAVLNAGATQRGIESEGIAADKAAFEAARDNPYKMLQFKQSMLQGMPIAATDVGTAQPSLIEQLATMGALGGNFGNFFAGDTTGTKT